MLKKCVDSGEFVLLTEEQIKQDEEMLNQIKRYQEYRNMYDSDRFLNEAKDGLAGRLIGFNIVNISKNGFDCKNSKGELLEVKAINSCSKKWASIFNDTTESKALEFKNKNVYVQVPIFLNAKDISFFLIGNNPDVGDFLLNAAINFKKSNSRRCSPNIDIRQLYRKYKYKIVAVDESKEQVVERLKNKYKKSFKDITVDDIMTVSEYNKWKENSGC